MRLVKLSAALAVTLGVLSLSAPAQASPIAWLTNTFSMPPVQSAKTVARQTAAKPTVVKQAAAKQTAQSAYDSAFVKQLRWSVAATDTQARTSVVAKPRPKRIAAVTQPSMRTV